MSHGGCLALCNWLANNEPSGSEGPRTTETGTYALNGSTGSAASLAVTRGSNADWVLPSVNEWYKAAYYAGGGTSRLLGVPDAKRLRAQQRALGLGDE